MEVNILLTKLQLNNLKKGKHINVSQKQLQGLNEKAIYNHSMNLSLAQKKKLDAGKAVRLGGSSIQGGNLWDDVKKTGNTIVSGLKVGGNEIASLSNQLSKTAKKQDWGGKIESIKSVVPKSTVETAMTLA